MGGVVFLMILLVLVVIFLVKTINVVGQGNAWVIEWQRSNKEGVL